MTDKEQKLIDRIKLMLGGDVLKIEIPDSSIYNLIDIAIETLSPYIPDTRYKTVDFARCIDLSNDDCEEVLRVMPGTQLASAYGVGDEYNFGFNMNSANSAILASWTSQDSFRLRAVATTVARSCMPDVNISFDYDRTTHKLYLHPGITLGPVTIEYIPTVFKLDDLQDSASQKWVYLYTLALTKEVIGRIRSKAKSQNVPIQLDGDTLLQEAQTEKLALEQELIDDSLGPVAYLR